MRKKTNGYGLSNTYRSKPAKAVTKQIKMPKISGKKAGRAVENSMNSAVSLVELPFLMVIGMINGIIALLTMFTSEEK